MIKKFDLYTFVYQDEDILPFFLDYYKWVNRMTFIDSDSTDKTQKIIKQFATPDHPIIRTMETGCKFWDQETLHNIRNNIWHDSTMDLVLFPDCDEIFYSPLGIREYLLKAKYDIFEMEGFEMISDMFPRRGTKITDIKYGFRFHPFNKCTIFNPKIDITFLNAHLRYSPCTNVDMTGNIKLLYYRNLGMPMMIKRNNRMKERLQKGYNGHHAETEDQLQERFHIWKQKSMIVI